jgi:hypothetical protein
MHYLHSVLHTGSAYELLELLDTYNPYKEDVYSVGVIILQMMLLVSSKELEILSKLEAKDWLYTLVQQKFINKKWN